MPTKVRSMAKGVSSISTRVASKRTPATTTTRNGLVGLWSASAVLEVVESSNSRSPLADVYESPEFRLEWDNEISFHVAQNAFHLRRRRRQSQTVVAHAMGTSQSAVARIEGGDENITLRTLKRLVVALDGRLRFAIEPKEAGLPRWPAWWEDGAHVITATEWTQRGIITQQDGVIRKLGAVWTSQEHWLESGHPLLGTSDAS